MKDFEKFTFIEPAINVDTNYIKEIRQKQCELCLIQIVFDYLIVHSFKLHTETKRAICAECEGNLS